MMILFICFFWLVLLPFIPMYGVVVISVSVTIGFLLVFYLLLFWEEGGVFSLYSPLLFFYSSKEMKGIGARDKRE